MSMEKPGSQGTPEEIKEAEKMMTEGEERLTEKRQYFNFNTVINSSSYMDIGKKPFEWKSAGTVNDAEDKNYQSLNFEEIKLPENLLNSALDIHDRIKILPNGYIIHREDNSMGQVRAKTSFEIMTCDEILEKLDPHIARLQDKLERLQKNLKLAELSKDALEKTKGELLKNKK